MHMTDTTLVQSVTPPPPSLLAGLGAAAALVTAIIGWFALGGAFLSESTLFGGLMLLWYWAKVEHLSMQRLPASIAGALVGIGVAWVMFYGASNYGAVGFSLGLLLLLIAIYLDIVQIFPLLFNASTMLYSIVAAAPLVQLNVNWVELCLATIGGGVFFGAYVAAVMGIAGKLSQRSS
jgi:hypothetical protein